MNLQTIDIQVLISNNDYKAGRAIDIKSMAFQPHHIPCAFLQARY